MVGVQRRWARGEGMEEVPGEGHARRAEGEGMDGGHGRRALEEGVGGVLGRRGAQETRAKGGGQADEHMRGGHEGRVWGKCWGREHGRGVVGVVADG